MKKTALVALSALSFAAFGAAFAAPASADLYGVSLNANESLALFGAEIPALWYDGTAYQQINFSYIGNTFAVRDMYRDAEIIGSGEALYYGNNLPDNNSSTEGQFISNPATTNYLIYRWIPPEHDDGVLPSPAAGGFRVRISLSTDIQCNAFQTAFLSSAGYGVFTGYNWPYDFLQLLDNNGDSLSKHTYYHTSGSGIRGYTVNLQFLPTYLRDSTGYDRLWWSPTTSQAYNSGLTWLNAIGVRGGAIIDDAPSITVSELVYQSTRIQAFRYADIIQETDDSASSALPSYIPGVGLPVRYTDWACYILVQCPIIYGDYVLPEPEYNTDENINNINNNTSQIVLTTDQLRQILLRMESVQQDIKTAETVHTNQLIDILSRLNAIYNAMDFSVPELQYAQTLPVDENAMQTVESALSEYEFPDYMQENQGVTQAASGVSGLLSGLKDALPGKVWNFIWFSVACGLIHWLLFHGRGA